MNQCMLQCRVFFAVCVVVAAHLLASGCQRSSTRPPGEYVYPTDFMLARRFAFIDDVPHPSIVVDAAFFDNKSPSELLVRPLRIDFRHNGDPDVGVFNKFTSSGFAFGYEPLQIYGEGTRPLKNFYGVLQGDNVGATETLDELFGALVSGIANGRWVRDPYLRTDGPGVSWVAPLCRLHVSMHPGSWEAYMLAGVDDLQRGIICIGTYYEGPGLYESDNVPRVFLTSNRTTSHIYLLDEECGRRVHDAALNLYKFLDAAYERVSFAHLVVTEEWRLAELPPAVPGEMIDVRWTFRGPPQTLAPVERAVLMREPPRVLVRTAADGARCLTIPVGKYTIRKGVLGMAVVAKRLLPLIDGDSPYAERHLNIDVTFDELEMRPAAHIEEYEPD